MPFPLNIQGSPSAEFKVWRELFDFYTKDINSLSTKYTKTDVLRMRSGGGN
jgi:hypothetical protein